MAQSKAVAFLVCMVLVARHELASQQTQIGIIDFYGLNRVAAADVRQALTMKEGDSYSSLDGRHLALFAESEKRLLQVPGVRSVRMEPVCCAQGRVILFIGIQENDAPVMRLRAAPGGSERLADDVIQAGEEFSKALLAAVQRGAGGEDRSLGHSLAHDPGLRAIQERFVMYARRDGSSLRRVLRDSADAVHRALAAQVLGYVTDKQAVVDDLVDAMSDASDNVRNNAMRALLVFTATEPTLTRVVPQVPYQPFVAFLSSPVWSDRNKAAGALMELTTKRMPALLDRLRSESLTPLAEMARWKSDEHAMAAFIILARLAGYTDEAAFAGWVGGNRASIIDAAIRPR
jgi:hypothetical protein